MKKKLFFILILCIIILIFIMLNIFNKNTNKSGQIIDTNDNTISHNLTHDTSANQNLTHDASTNQNLTHDASTNQNLTHDTSANQNLTHDTSANQNLTHDTSANQNLTHDTSANQNLTHDASTNQNLTHDTSANQNLTHDTSANQNLTHDASANQNLTHDASANQNLTHDTSANQNLTHDASAANNNFSSYYKNTNIFTNPNGYVKLNSNEFYGNYTLTNIISGKNKGFCPTIYISKNLFASNGTNQSNPEYIAYPLSICYLTGSVQVANYLGGKSIQVIMILAVPQGSSNKVIQNYIKSAIQYPCNYPILTSDGLATFPNMNQALIFKR